MKITTLLALPLALAAASNTAAAAALSGYSVQTCSVEAKDGNFLSCKCPSGNVALGGGCWITSAPTPPSGSPLPSVSASVVASDGYYCASNFPGVVISITVSCASSQ